MSWLAHPTVGSVVCECDFCGMRYRVKDSRHVWESFGGRAHICDGCAREAVRVFEEREKVKG